MRGEDIMQVRMRLSPLVSELYPGLFDSDTDLLQDMLQFAAETLELQEDCEPDMSVVYDRVARAIRTLSGDIQ